MQDFTKLKQPPKITNPEVFHLRKISASQLFQFRNRNGNPVADIFTENMYRTSSNRPYLERTFSQPTLPQTENHLDSKLYTSTWRKKSQTPALPRRNRHYERNEFSRQLRVGSINSRLRNSHSSNDNVSKAFQKHNENLYEIIQEKLNAYKPIKKHGYGDKQSGGYIDEELSSDAFLEEGWEKSIQQIADAGRLDANLLEAIFLLRNAHKRGFFDGEASKESIDSSIAGYSDNPHSLENSIDGESTPTNLSLPSSGCSTPSVKRRPKKPEIRISDFKTRGSYVEICRRDSLCSMDSEYGGSVTSDDSFMNIPESVIAEAVLNSQFTNGQKRMHEFEETLKQPVEALSFKASELKQICDNRPGSPTSEFLAPLLHVQNDELAKELHCRLSPMLHKVNKLEEDSKKLSMLQVKLAVLQEEKRQLSMMLEQKRDHSSGGSVVGSTSHYSPVESKQPHKTDGQNSLSHKDVGVQKFFEIITEISHKQTSTDVQHDSIGIGDGVADIRFMDQSTGNHVSSADFSCQRDLTLENCDVSTNTIPVCYVDSANGNSIEYHSISTQQTPITISTATQSYGNGSQMSRETQTVIKSEEKFVSVGSSISQLVTSSAQCSIEKEDFSCGNGIAEVIFKDVETQKKDDLRNVSTNTDISTLVDATVSCDIRTETKSEGVGDGNVFDVICDKCTKFTTTDADVGVYLDDQPCGILDELCNCTKPELVSVGIGDDCIDDICCDRCVNLKLVSVGVGDCKVNDLLCDKCGKSTTASKGVGSTSIDDPLYCDICQKKPKTKDKGVGNISEDNLTSIGVGENNVFDETCSKCNNDDNIFNFDLNIINKPPVTQQPILCHYCGNKVDLNDEHLDESLQAMRESMQSIRSGMKRSTATKNLNIDIDDEDNLETHHKVESAEGSVSDDYHTIISDEEEESASSGRNDVIEACQMLHQHFSGEKPLKQQQMLKYMGIIQVLWFKTVKKRRANASVVKSYIDLFQQRIPELMETIINLTDDEGNTALHYALTYKNYGVVSILLDSRECAVDLVNQAGYSPIMLAALAGFEKKNDKYIMQRLLRMGDINKESADTGQTPLMLAVTRGNLGMIELLLDAGCDINATDDEGSTALMCACEHGIINIVKTLLGHPGCDVTIEDNEGSTALSIAMDSRRKDLALLIYGSLNFDTRGRIKLSPSKQSLLGLGRRSPSPVIGRR